MLSLFKYKYQDKNAPEVTFTVSNQNNVKITVTTYTYRNELKDFKPAIERSISEIQSRLKHIPDEDTKGSINIYISAEFIPSIL